MLNTGRTGVDGAPVVTVAGLRGAHPGPGTSTTSGSGVVLAEASEAGTRTRESGTTGQVIIAGPAT